MPRYRWIALELLLLLMVLPASTAHGWVCDYRQVDPGWITLSWSPEPPVVRRFPGGLLQQGDFFEFFVYCDPVTPITAWEGGLIVPEGIQVVSLEHLVPIGIDFSSGDQIQVGLGYALEPAGDWIPLVRVTAVVTQPIENFAIYLKNFDPPSVRPSSFPVFAARENDGTGCTMEFLMGDTGILANVTATGAPFIEPADSLELLPNSPNPFNPRTVLRFEVASPEPAQLLIHDARGRVVRRFSLSAEQVTTGRWPWDGRDEQGRPAASGVYRVSMETESGRTAHRPVTLLR